MAKRRKQKSRGKRKAASKSPRRPTAAGDAAQTPRDAQTPPPGQPGPAAPGRAPRGDEDLSEMVDAEAHQARGPEVLISRTGVAILSFVVLSMTIYFAARLIQGKGLDMPGMKFFRSAKDRPARSGPLPRAAQRQYAPKPEVKTTVRPVEGKPSTLERFFEKLLRSEERKPGAITRIAHIGDSQQIEDNISGEVRRMLQQRFGDAGHGYLVVGSHHDYKQNNVSIYQKGDWRHVGVWSSSGFPDRRYGLYGVHTYAVASAYARFATSTKGPVGGKVSRFEVAYLQHTDGGYFRVDTDGKAGERISTRAPRGAPTTTKIWRTEVPDGEHAFAITSLGAGATRLLGAVMERSTPGVVYDAVGLKGVEMHDLLRIDAEHWKRQLRWRRPDLLVLAFGTNETWSAIEMDDYEKRWGRLIRRAREALPQLSCLLVGPIDRIERGTQSHRRIAPLTEAMRRTARAEGCAFWDTFASMGGPGAAARWDRAGLLYGDKTHLTPRGGRKLGRVLGTAILERYDNWKRLRRYHEQQRKAAQAPDAGATRSATPTPNPNPGP